MIKSERIKHCQSNIPTKAIFRVDKMTNQKPPKAHSIGPSIPCGSKPSSLSSHCWAAFEIVSNSTENSFWLFKGFLFTKRME